MEPPTLSSFGKNFVLNYILIVGMFATTNQGVLSTSVCPLPKIVGLQTLRSYVSRFFKYKCQWEATLLGSFG